jgi:hypothetical protein
MQHKTLLALLIASAALCNLRFTSCFVGLRMHASPSLESRGCAKPLLSAHVISLRLVAGGARLRRLALVR